MLRPLLLIASVSLSPAVCLAADPIEAIGAERCGGRTQQLSVTFLAPESTLLEARAKILKGGSDELSRLATLSMNGKPCERSSCPFQATKGTTYNFEAETGQGGFDDLCISVSRP